MQQRVNVQRVFTHTVKYFSLTITGKWKVSLPIKLPCDLVAVHIKKPVEPQVRHSKLLTCCKVVFIFLQRMERKMLLRPPWVKIGKDSPTHDCHISTCLAIGIPRLLSYQYQTPNYGCLPYWKWLSCGRVIK